MAAKADWKFLVFIVGCSLLVFMQPARWIVEKTKNRGIDEEKSNHLVIAVEHLRRKIKKRSAKDHVIDIWEPLLMAAQLELERELNLASGLIKTNLLLSCPPDSIEVVARSKPGSATPSKYKTLPYTPAGKAMESNLTSISCSIDTSKKEWGKRPYRCVAATPIVEGDFVYGVITADSPEPKTFKNYEAAIDAVLRPYCALVLLTLNEDAPYYKCPKRYAK